MKPEVSNRLLALNAEFYEVAASHFDATRGKIWPGLNRISQYLTELGVSSSRVLDAGCGNGRLLPFVVSELSACCYVGVDASTALLHRAQVRAKALGGSTADIQFLQVNLTEPGWTSKLEIGSRFDVIFCLATLHHIPTQSLRCRTLESLAGFLNQEGILVLSNWQPHHSPRQCQKMVDWSVLALTESDIDVGDCLISWKQGIEALRYVHILNREEVARLAQQAGLRVLLQFEADGLEKNLNLYSVLQKI